MHFRTEIDTDSKQSNYNFRVQNGFKNYLLPSHTVFSWFSIMSVNKCFSYASRSRQEAPTTFLLKFRLLCVDVVIDEFAGRLKTDDLK